MTATGTIIFSTFEGFGEDVWAAREVVPVDAEDVRLVCKGGLTDAAIEVALLDAAIVGLAGEAVLSGVMEVPAV